MSSTPLLQIDHPADGIACITLTHTSKANALDNDLCAALIQAITTLDQDQKTRVIILSHKGKIFSAGGDIKAMQRGEDMFQGSAEDIAKQYQAIIHPLQLAIHEAGCVFIAAIDGSATGAGNDIVAQCDFAIASEHSRFSESFINLGIISGDGGLWILAHKIGLSNAALMAYTGEWFSAQAAHEMGLISQVVSAEDLATSCLDLAQRIAKQPKQALTETRRLLRQSLNQSFREHLADCAQTQGKLHHHLDHKQRLEQLMQAIAKRRHSP